MTRRAPKVRQAQWNEPPPRTFHYEFDELSGMRCWVKNGYTLVPCTGEAHINAFIDHCMTCMSGTWGWSLKVLPK